MIKYVKFFLLVFSFTSLLAQVGDGSDLLKELQNKYNSIDDFTSDFRQATKAGHVATGKFYYKSKDKFRIELGSRTIVGNGETVWNYSPKNKKVIITAADDEANSFSIEDYVFNYPEQCKLGVTKNEDGKDVLILKPKTNELDFQKIEIVVNSNYLIDKMSMTDLMDNTYDVDLRNTKINQNLDDKLFTFDIPQGTQLIDLR